MITWSRGTPSLPVPEHVWDDVAVATSFRQADRSWARRFAVAMSKIHRSQVGLHGSEPGLPWTTNPPRKVYLSCGPKFIKILYTLAKLLPLAKTMFSVVSATQCRTQFCCSSNEASALNSGRKYMLARCTCTAILSLISPVHRRHDAHHGHRLPQQQHGQQ